MAGLALAGGIWFVAGTQISRLWTASGINAAHQVTRWPRRVDAVQHPRSRTAPRGTDHPGHGFHAAVADGGQQRADGGLVLAPDHRVDSSLRLGHYVAGDERDAVTAEEDEAPRGTAHFDAAETSIASGTLAR